jgi:vacuole morphology and inheritance protein 14
MPSTLQAFCKYLPRCRSPPFSRNEITISCTYRTSMGSVSGRSKIGRDEIKWQDLLQHFRQVQGRHEKARRQATGVDASPLSGYPELEKTEVYNEKTPRSSGRVPMRRRVTGGDLGTTVPTPRSGVLSPLNPKARGPSGVLTSSHAGVVTNNLNAAASLTQAQKGRRPPDLLRK